MPQGCNFFPSTFWNVWVGSQSQAEFKVTAMLQALYHARWTFALFPVICVCVQYSGLWINSIREIKGGAPGNTPASDSSFWDAQCILKPEPQGTWFTGTCQEDTQPARAKQTKIKAKQDCSEEARVMNQVFWLVSTSSVHNTSVLLLKILWYFHSTLAHRALTPPIADESWPRRHPKISALYLPSQKLPMSFNWARASHWPETHAWFHGT